MITIEPTKYAQYISDDEGVRVGVFVPIDVWQTLPEKEQVPFTDVNAIKARNEAGGELRKRPLTEEELQIKAQLDAFYSVHDNCLDPLMAEIQARSIPREEW